MTAGRQCTLEELHRQIHQIPGFEQVANLRIPIGEGSALLLVYEKYYLRSSYASLCVLLTERSEAQAAYIVSSGGGDGLSNYSYGANRKLAEECARALEGMGFTVNPETSDALPRNLLERFLK